MSVKIFNSVTNQWEQVSTTVATGVKVVDLENQLDADNVNDGLLKVAADLKTLAGVVQYINESGTIGGGGGGGGGGSSSRPLITLISPSTVEVTTVQTLDIKYVFSSPHDGNGEVTIDCDSGTYVTPNVKQDQMMTQTVGPFAKSNTPHLVIIKALDAEGFASVVVRVTVIAGSLDLTSTFNDANDFTVGDVVKIPFTLSTYVASNSTVFTLDYWLGGYTDSYKHTTTTHTGSDTLTLPALDTLGLTTVRMEVINAFGTHSNPLNFSLVASDATSLHLIAGSFPDVDLSPIANVIHIGTNLVLDYRVSMKGQNLFYSALYIDDVLIRNAPNVPGINRWNVGVAGVSETLSPGPHFLKVVTSTPDGLYTDQIIFWFEVAVIDYLPYHHITTDLIAQFDAIGKFNSSIDNDIWVDTSGHHVGCDLYDFNYTTNGWNDTTNALDFSGKSYAVINLKPFLDDIPFGFTFEVLFKTKCVGNVDAKVLSCRNSVTPFTGFDINTESAIFQAGLGYTVKTEIQEDVWTKLSFVVNRVDDTVRLNTIVAYVNGAISNVSLMPFSTTPPYAPIHIPIVYDGLIYLGAEFNNGIMIDNSPVINNSTCSIKSIRIYNRALTDIEIVTNYIADINDPEEQKAARRLNCMSDPDPITGEFGFDINNPDTKLTIPRMTIKMDPSLMGEDTKKIATRIDYEDPDHAGNSFTSEENGARATELSWQGTSSKTYPVKNWTLKAETAQGLPLLTTPRAATANGETINYTDGTAWLTDLRWTLKANYMDSSNVNNIGLQKYIRDCFKVNVPPYPSEQGNPLVRPNVDGFPIYVEMNNGSTGSSTRFIGIYTFNIDRYGLQNNGFVTYDSAGVEDRKDNTFSYEINSNSNTGAGAFALPSTAAQIAATPSLAQANWDAVATAFRCRYAFADMDLVTDTVGSIETLKQGSHQQLLDLVQWVNDTEAFEFHRDLALHFSIPHLIDYYLIAYLFGMVDNLGKNMVLTTFNANAPGGEPVIWYPSFYDCDSVLGLDNTGAVVHDAGVDPMINVFNVDPDDLPNGNYNTSESKLWTKLATDVQANENSFSEQIRKRYEVLRNPKDGITWFSAATVMQYLGAEMDKIGAIFTSLDAREKFLPTTKPDAVNLQENDPEMAQLNALGWFDFFYKPWTYACNGTRRQFTERWLKERFDYLDSVFEFGPYQANKIALRSNVTAPVVLKLKTYSPQWVRISFSDEGDDVKRLVRSNNPDTTPSEQSFTENGFRLFNGNLDHVNNNIDIFGATGIMYIDGINSLDVDSLHLEKAFKLVELDVSFSPRLQVLGLDSNIYLQKLKCNDCSGLGDPTAQNSVRDLNISKCVNLRELNLARTHINNVNFNPVGGVLTSLDATGTDLISFSLVGQDYLTSIQLAGCTSLDALQITNCNSLVSLVMPDTKLSTVRIAGCNNLTTLDLRQTKNLKIFDVSGCPNLKTLTMIGVSNPALTELDLSYCPQLEDFDMSSSGYIAFLKLPSFPSLKPLEKLRVNISPGGVATAILPVKKVLLSSIGVHLAHNLPRIADADISTTYTTETTPDGFVTITFMVSTSIPVLANQRWVYVDYSNNSCLASFKCSSSALVSLKFGRVPPLSGIGVSVDSRGYPIRSSDLKNTLDLSGLPLTTIDFGGCGDLIEVRNINYTGSGVEKFRECTSLKNITGSLTFNGSMATGFYNCKVLQLPPLNTTGIPDPTKLILNLTGVTSMQDTFWRCSALTAGNARDILRGAGTDLVNLFRTFGECIGITGTFFQSYNTPPLFGNCTNVTTINRLFAGCTGITGLLPLTLLAPMTKLTDATLAFQACFSTGTAVGGIPYDANAVGQKGFFDANVLLTNTTQMFWGCNKLTSLPNPIANMFKYNVALTTVNQMFLGCSSLVVDISACDNLFIANPLLVDLSSFFQGCIKVTGSIAPNLFNNIKPGLPNNLKFLNLFFYGTGISGEIPTGLLDRCVKLEQANDLFRDCIGLTGAIPPTLFATNTKLTSLGGSISLTPTGGVYLGGSVVNGVQVGGTLVTQGGLQVTVGGVFAGCRFLTGAIPPRLLRDKPDLNIANGMFLNCERLESEIPRNFLNDCPKLTDISDMFSGCVGLTGNIPSRDSFWNTTESFNIDSKIVLTASFPDVGLVKVKINAGSAEFLIRDTAYTVAVTDAASPSAVVTITVQDPALKSLTTFVVVLPRIVTIVRTDVATATIPGAGVDIDTLVVRDRERTIIYEKDIAYTLSVSPENDNIITVVTGGGVGLVPDNISELRVEYNYTAPVDRIAVMDTNSIDTSTPFVVRPVIDSEIGNITTSASTVTLTGLSGANKCIVKVDGSYTGSLIPQTSTDNIVWTNISGNVVANLHPALNGAGPSPVIPSAAKGVFEFSILGKTGVRISGPTTSGTATVTVFACSIGAALTTDYTLVGNAAEVRLTRNPGSIAIPFNQSQLVVTFKHTDPTMVDYLDIKQRESRPSLLGQIETVVLDTELSEYKYGFLDKQSKLVRAANVFYRCSKSSFSGTIPPKLFLTSTLLNDISGFFGFCMYLTGWYPPALLYNCTLLTRMRGTFQECRTLRDPVAAYVVPPNLLEKCRELIDLSWCFNQSFPNLPVLSNATGVLHKDLFKYNTKINDITYIFAGTSHLEGVLPDDLFKANTALINVAYAFWATGITGIGPNLFFTCTKIVSMESTFLGCGAVGTAPSVGGVNYNYAPNYWASSSPLRLITFKSGCFAFDANLATYNTLATVPPNPNRIPNDWGNITPPTP